MHSDPTPAGIVVVVVAGIVRVVVVTGFAAFAVPPQAASRRMGRIALRASMDGIVDLFRASVKRRKGRMRFAALFAN
jgi:hypothetical protein